MKGLIEYIATSLVDDPASVSVRQREGAGGVFIELNLPSEQMGKVIGKEGRIANAMRLLLRVAANRHGKHAALEISPRADSAP
jgi:predicted RNA-binding protein YlqC (UPF0109 family)